MKKALLILLLIIAAFLAAVYIFIPGELSVSSSLHVAVAPTAAERVFGTSANLTKWSPGKVENNTILLRDQRFTIGQPIFRGRLVQIDGGNIHSSSILHCLPVTNDTSVLLWQWSIKSSLNPFVRLGAYNNAVEVKQNMDSILMSFGKFVGDPSNVYSIKVQQVSITDTVMVFTKKQVRTPPTVSDVYQLVHGLQTYVNNKGAQQSGTPMLNFPESNNNTYELMVALPINKVIDASGAVQLKRMVPGHFLTTEVYGDQAAIDSAYKEVKLYMEDYQRVAMAIPFQYLVTDRSIEKDSTKWITRIYFPVY